MEAKIEILTLGELKKQLKALEEMPDVTDETKFSWILVGTVSKS